MLFRSLLTLYIAIWQALRTTTCFSACLSLWSPSRQPPALAELVGLYVGRSHTLWREGGVLLWLEQNVTQVLLRVDNNEPLVEDCLNK